VFGFRWADDGLSSIGEALQLVRAFDGLFSLLTCLAFGGLSSFGDLFDW